MFDINRILTHFQRSYYTSLLMMLAEIVALVIGLIYYKKERTQKFFLIYIITDLTILISDLSLGAITTIPEIFFSNFLLYTNALIAIVELYCYYYFFFQLFESKRIKKALRIMAMLFGLFTILYLTASLSYLSERLTYITYFFGATEFIFILPFCLLYYQRLLTRKNNIPIFLSPAFWLTSGIFFFSVFSIPGYLLFDYIKNNYPGFINIFLAAFYFLPIVINFSFISKAFLLKKKFTY